MRTHRPALTAAVFLGFGIVAGQCLVIPFFIWVGLLTAAVIIAYLDRWVWLIYLSVFLLGGVLISNAYRLPSNSVAFLNYNQRQSIKLVEGIVDSQPKEMAWAHGKRQVFDLRVKRVLMPQGWVAKTGKIQVNVFKPVGIAYGQELQLAGKLYAIYAGKPGEKFSYRRYLQEQGVYWAMSVGKQASLKIIAARQGNPFVVAALVVKARIKQVFTRLLDPSQEGMITAMVLGERGGIPKWLREIFVNTGTAHIIAISGMNMAIITAMVFFLLKCCRLSRRWQLIGTSLFLFAYAFLTGWSPSVVRACLMSSVLLFSFALEAEGEPLNSWGLAAFILLLMDPKNLFDIGFQLSFAAVLAILVLYEPCRRLLACLPDLIAKPLAVSLAAWLGTAPFIFYHFKMITPVSIIANIPIVPLADLTVALGLSLGVTGLIGDWLALPVAACLKAIFNLMVILAAHFNQIPWGHLLYR